MTTIGYQVFYSCGFTGSLSIPDKVKTIEEGAFLQCRGFTGSLTVPESVASIEESAFYGCNGIADAYFYGDAPTAGVNYFGTGIFGPRDSAFTVYRLASASGWPAAGEKWNGYKTAIFMPD